MLERCGRDDRVIKFMPALTIDEETLSEGLQIYEQALTDALHGTLDNGAKLSSSEHNG